MVNFNASPAFMHHIDIFLKNEENKQLLFQFAVDLFNKKEGNCPLLGKQIISILTTANFPLANQAIKIINLELIKHTFSPFPEINSRPKTLNDIYLNFKER